MTVGNQIYVFLSCVLCGVAGGILYDFFFSLRLPFRGIWAKIVADVCFFLCFAGLYLFLSLLFSYFCPCLCWSLEAEGETEQTLTVISIPTV